MNDSCPPEVEGFYSFGPLITLQWSQLVCSLLSIVIVVYTAVFHLRKSWFEGVFKETLFALYFFIGWHSVTMSLLYTIQLVKRVTATAPCDIQFDRKICILRILMTIATPSFVLIHVALTVQRIVTTFSGNRILHLVIARLGLLLTLAYGVGYLFVGYREYPMEGTTPYCSGYSVGEEVKILSGYFRMVFIDFLNVIMTFVLLFYNRSKIHKLSATPLGVKFRCRQTFRSIQQMLPVALLNLLGCAFQYFGFRFGLTYFQKFPETQRIILNGFFYTTTYYCVLCPAILLLIMKLEEKKKRRELKSISTTSSEAATDEYFTSLQSQWDRHLPTEKTALRARSA